MTMFARGRRLFSVASIAMILVAGLHTLGNLAPPPALAGDPRGETARTAMTAYTLPLGMGMTPSMWDIFRSLVFTMSVCLTAMGVLGLVVAASRSTTATLLSGTAWVLALASAALTVMYAVYQIPPPLISLAVVTLLYGGAVVTTRSA